MWYCDAWTRVRSKRGAGCVWPNQGGNLGGWLFS